MRFATLRTFAVVSTGVQDPVEGERRCSTRYFVAPSRSFQVRRTLVVDAVATRFETAGGVAVGRGLLGVGVAVGAGDTSMVIESSTSVWPLCLVFRVTLPLPGGLQPSSVQDLVDFSELRGLISKWHVPGPAKPSRPLVTMYTL